MEKEPEIPQTNKIELDPVESIGYLDYKGFRVRYNVATETQDDINASEPANHAWTPDTGGGKTLSIWVWEGVPQKFREILLQHELIEADLKLNQNRPKAEAHKAAFEYHMRYAKEHLNEEDYKEFLEWQSTIKFHI